MRRFIAAIAALALGMLAIGAAGAVGAAPPKAKKTSSTAWASVVKTEGTDLIAAGYFVDKVLGKGAVIYRVKAAPDTTGAVTLTADPITLYTAKGTMTGTGTATQTPNPDGTATITNGKISLKKGTGAYKGHTLVSTFNGTFINGVLTLTATGTYR